MSTRTRLIIYFGLLAAVGALSFVVLWLAGIPALGIQGIQSAEHRRAILGVEAAADKERDAFERWFADRRRELHIMSRNELLSAAIAATPGLHGTTGAFRREQLERILSQIKESNVGAYNYLYVVSPRGRLIAGTEPDWGIQPAEHDGFLREAVQPGLTEFVYMMGEAYGPTVIITNQVPVLDMEGLPSGEIAGVLVASVSLNAPFAVEESALRLALGESAMAVLIDREAHIITSTTRVGNTSRDYLGKAVVHGSEGVKTLRAPGGSEELVAFRHLHLGAAEGLTLAVVRSADEALVGVRQSFLRLGGIGLLMFAVAMGLVLFAARRIAIAENQIRQLNASLETRVATRTRELEHSNTSLRETLEHLERTRDDLVRSEKLAGLGALVAGVAHEMNTPIGNALLVATTLKAEAEEFSVMAADKLSRTALTKHLANTRTGNEMLVSNLERAAELVKSFKQLAADQTSEQRRVFDLAVMVGEVGVAMRPLIKQSPHQLTVGVPNGLRLDSFPGPLSRILVNFINNALLHAFEGRDHGQMHLQARQIDEHSLEITFADDGNGMSEETVRHVFDPFFTTKLGKGGSGLGMHLAYNIVATLLGGDISIESALGKGTRFTLRLPLVAPQMVVTVD